LILVKVIRPVEIALSGGDGIGTLALRVGERIRLPDLKARSLIESGYAIEDKLEGQLESKNVYERIN